MIRIIIQKAPQSRLFDRMPLPSIRRSKPKIGRLRTIARNRRFVRKISKIYA